MLVVVWRRRCGGGELSLCGRRRIKGKNRHSNKIII